MIHQKIFWDGGVGGIAWLHGTESNTFVKRPDKTNPDSDSLKSSKMLHKLTSKQLVIEN
uniref:Uncharacterized protein n=1 Tax=Rhizophagus irregularis (strain DAOM 181602 / DAOM 197198 / MUCL 43194) TaxID=747089 RepID=U9UUS7_RHIID